MTLMEKAAHAAERKAFEKVLENFIQKGKTADAASAAQDLVDMAEKIQGSVWKKESFEVLHMIAGQPEGKWAHYVQRILDETDPYILKTFLTNAVYEGGFRGYQQAQKNAEKYGCNIPWLTHPYGPHLRLQYALHRLLGRRIRPPAEPDL